MPPEAFTGGFQGAVVTATAPETSPHKMTLRTFLKADPHPSWGVISAPIPRCKCGGQWNITHGRTGYEMADDEKNKRPFQAMAAAVLSDWNVGCTAECDKCGERVTRLNESEVLDVIAGPEIEKLKARFYAENL